MLVPKLYSLICMGVISSGVVLASTGCQPSPEIDTTEAVPEDSQGDPDAAADASSAASPSDAAPSTTGQPEESPTEAAAAGLAAAAEQQCSASAFVVDTDPAGLNVRGGPDSEFPVIDTLPTDGPVEVTIAGATNGWFKLTVAWSLAQQELEEPGWVYGPLLGVTTRSSSDSGPEALVPLASEPQATTVVAELPASTEVTLLSCTGEWLQVQSETGSGWLAADNQCSSPVTTCP